LGDDPTALPADRRAQAEPQIIRSFTNPNLVVGTFQEGRYTDGGAVDCGYTISQDGGRTWRRGLIPHLSSQLDDGSFARASDPVAALDLQDNIYLSTVGLNGPSSGFTGTLCVSKSTDGGLTFAAPVFAYTNPDPNVFADKPWIAINTFSNTPSANRVVITYTGFWSTNNGLTSVNPIMALHSDDGGTNWTQPQVISPPDCQGSQPLFLPDGSLVVAYWNFAGSSGYQIEAVVSADGGATFSPPRLVSPISIYWDPVARAEGFLPSAATDRQAGILYVTTQAMFTDTNGSAPRILFTRSRDKGLTWTKPLPVNDTPAQRGVFNPAIAVSPDGQHVTIVFYDKRHDNGTGRLVDLYLAESFDGGDTWGANLRLSDVTSDMSLAPLTGWGYMLGDYIGIAPELNPDAPAVAIWIDTRSGSPDPFAVRIDRTQGTTFDAWRRLRFTPSELLDAAVSGPPATPAGDGVPNLFKYALALEPRQKAESADLGLRGVVESNGLLALSLDTLRAASDLKFDWRTSSDLATWKAATPVNQRTVPGGSPSLLRLTFYFLPPGAGSHFFQLGLQ